MALDNLPSHKRYLDQTLDVYRSFRPALSNQQIRDMLAEEASKLQPPISLDELNTYFNDNKIIG
jgi:hypothetical protein